MLSCGDQIATQNVESAVGALVLRLHYRSSYILSPLPLGSGFPSGRPCCPPPLGWAPFGAPFGSCPSPGAVPGFVLPPPGFGVGSGIIATAYF